MRRGLSALAIVAWLVAPAAADWALGDPYKMHFPQLPDVHGWDVNATLPKVLADDWTCTETGPITQVHFWGSWKNIDGDIATDDVGVIQWFRMSVHTNIPVGPGGYSIPGPAIWVREIPFSAVRPRQYDPTAQEGWFDPNTGEAIHPDHQNYWQYNIDLTQLFPPQQLPYQEAGQVYWLDLAASVEPAVPGTPQPMWGWKTADTSLYPPPFTGQHYLDDAVWGDMPNLNWQELREPRSGESLDLAFVVVPEPSSLAFVAVAGLLFWRRR